MIVYCHQRNRRMEVVRANIVLQIVSAMPSTVVVHFYPISNVLQQV